MKTIPLQRRVGAFVSAIVILLQISPGLGAGATDNAGNNQYGTVAITFTKWLIPDSRLMAGFVGGDVDGDFAGEVLQFQPSANGKIVRLEAIYEVQAGKRSFTALVRGGQNNETRTAILDGVILGGRWTGARVHVEYEVMTDCPGAPAGFCFQGTIRIERHSED